MEILSALVSRAARVTVKDPDVVLLRNELRAALLGEDMLNHHKQQADREEPLLGWRYDVTEASVLKLEVVQAYMGRVMEGGRADVIKPLTLREVADKVDRLMNELTETKPGSVQAPPTSPETLSTSWQTSPTSLQTAPTSLDAGRL